MPLGKQALYASYRYIHTSVRPFVCEHAAFCFGAKNFTYKIASMCDEH